MKWYIYISYNEKWNDDTCLFGMKRSPHGDLFVKKMLGRRPRRSRGVQGWRGGIVYSKCNPVVLRNGSLLLTHILHVIGFLPREVSQFNFQHLLVANSPTFPPRFWVESASFHMFRKNAPFSWHILSSHPWDVQDKYESMKIIGERQVTAAKTIFERATEPLGAAIVRFRRGHQVIVFGVFWSHPSLPKFSHVYKGE